jgi:thioredoxin reductase (NADPH)
MEKEFYDFVIVGGGVAGLAGAMYAARLGLKVAVFGTMNSSELPFGGVITTTDIVENYPGFTKISGVELADNIRKHAQSYELVKLKEEKVIEVKRDEKNHFEIKTDSGVYCSFAVLFATGTKWKKLEVPGSNEFENRGVAYCALCDSPLYKNKIVGVVGGSDSAVKDALVLAEHASKVYVIYRGEKLRAEPINLKRLELNKKIEIMNFANIKEIRGDKKVQEVLLDREVNGSNILKLDGLFIAIGHTILSELALDLGVALNEKKEIIINHKTAETNIEGIFAAGDVADKPFKQAITGVAEGCTAAHSAYEYITKNKIEPC